MLLSTHSPSSGLLYFSLQSNITFQWTICPFIKIYIMFVAFIPLSEPHNSRISVCLVHCTSLISETMPSTEQVLDKYSLHEGIECPFWMDHGAFNQPQWLYLIFLYYYRSCCGELPSSTKPVSFYTTHFFRTNSQSRVCIF